MDESLKILEKVRALLNKTSENGCTESEVEAALKLAQNLMMKHNIDQSEIFMSANDIDINLIENKFKAGEAKFWIWDLLCIIGKGYNCKVQRQGYTDHYFWRIIGMNEDRKMVLGLYETILPIIRNLVTKRFREYTGGKSRGIFTRSYIEGFLYGLSLKLDSNRKEYLKFEDKTKYELIVIKKDDLIEDWMEKDRKGEPVKYAKAKPRERDTDEQAARQGFLDGKEESYNEKLH